VLAYQPAEIGFCDLTRLKRVAITLRGELFPQLLFHYRLAWSGWAYGQITHGRESFLALSEGLRNGMAACGGLPRELCTDRLSAASRKRALRAHYGLSPFRNNRAWPMRTASSRHRLAIGNGGWCRSWSS
jgi:hypothetical protein